MELATAQFSVLPLTVGLGVPSVGPLVDHHFAERHSAYSHVSAVTRLHTHVYQNSHTHYHHSSGTQPFALYNHDSVSTASVIMVAEDTAMQS